MSEEETCLPEPPVASQSYDLVERIGGDTWESLGAIRPDMCHYHPIMPDDWFVRWKQWIANGYTTTDDQPCAWCAWQDRHDEEDEDEGQSGR